MRRMAPELLIALVFGAFTGMVKAAAEGGPALSRKARDASEEAVWAMLEVRIVTRARRAVLEERCCSVRWRVPCTTSSKEREKEAGGTPPGAPRQGALRSLHPRLTGSGRRCDRVLDPRVRMSEGVLRWRMC